MHRFYVSSQNISGDKIIIDGKSCVHHIRDVLRLKAKETVVVCDERGYTYASQIESISNKITLNIKKKYGIFQKEDGIRVSVACAIPKASKMDEIIDKLTQLGVERIIPLETERVIVKLNKEKEIARLKRWQKIALAASQQSQRQSVPIVEPIKDFSQVLSETKDGFDLKLIPTLALSPQRQKTLKEILDNAVPKRVLVLIGPEGDFTTQEIESARKAGCIPVSLGDLVLRVDTAAIAVVSFIRLYENG